MASVCSLDGRSEAPPCGWKAWRSAFWVCFDAHELPNALSRFVSLFWVIMLWVVLSGVVGCLFWHGGRHNCFVLQTLIIAVIGSCWRGACRLLDLLSCLMPLKKATGWPAGMLRLGVGTAFWNPPDECLNLTVSPRLLLHPGQHCFLPWWPPWSASFSFCPQPFSFPTD